jgi:imidazolonepropionase-like amidohydrolase
MNVRDRLRARRRRAGRLEQGVAVVGIALSTISIAAYVQTWGPQAPPYKADHPIAIVGGLLIDATGSAPKHDETVVIQGDRIVEIGPMETVKVPAGAEVIDAAGMTVMPGLINSNQHIQLNPLFPSPPANLPLANFKARWEKNWARQPYHAFVYLMQGITSLRNTSGPAEQIVPVKHAIDKGEIPGPRLFLGAALFQSEVSFKAYATAQRTPTDAVDFVRDEFAYHVVGDVDRDTKAYEGADFNFWKLIMSDKKFDGSNDFTDEQLRAFIAKAHKLGKKVDVHCGGNNDGLRRMLAFDVDTLEHPFLRNQIVGWDIIQGYVKKGVIVDTLLIQMLSEAMHAIDPHRFDESIYAMSLDPAEYRILMAYRDKMAASLRKPSDPGAPYYDASMPPDAPQLAGTLGESSRESLPVDELRKRTQTSKENMRRFIKAGAKFSMGTDTGAFLNFQQEDPNARELMLMVEMGMDPMKAIEAGTRNGAEALGQLKELGTIEKGKLADVIVVAGNPLQNMAAMKRVAYVIKGGVRFK